MLWYDTTAPLASQPANAATVPVDNPNTMASTTMRTKLPTRAYHLLTSPAAATTPAPVLYALTDRRGRQAPGELATPHEPVRGPQSLVVQVAPPTVTVIRASGGGPLR
jgi:hypothetical protein